MERFEALVDGPAVNVRRSVTAGALVVPSIAVRAWEASSEPSWIVERDGQTLVAIRPDAQGSITSIGVHRSRATDGTPPRRRQAVACRR
ncbi:hypothetical protein [Dactylosporangium sp. NPDC048998]|uniref:hypothetical protein n=1 Tax=Dactylosporangium sp. NPDC048998 TaxID=3363976 RepID=UPI003722D71A